MRYFLLLAAVATIVLGYVAYYFQVEQGVRDGVVAWVEMRRQQGIEAGYDGLASRGFPFRVVVELDAPRLAAPSAPGAPAWQGRRLSGVIQPWNLEHLILDLSGDGEVSFAQSGRRLAYAVEQGLASVEGGAGRLARLAVDLGEVSLSEAATAVRLTTARLQFHLRPGERPSGLWRLTYKAERSRIEAEGTSPLGITVGVLGPEIALAMVEVTLNGRHQSSNGMAAATVAEVVARWRDTGGSAEINRFKLSWGTLDVEADGTLSLDAEMRPIGALTARVRGHGKLIEALVRTRLMAPAAANGARAVLDLLAKAGGGVLAVPLTLQNGVLSLGPVALARLSPLLRRDGRSPVLPSPARRR
ncbi:MAG: DUF2125 domain-containing protein [Alphaproteobacteria bacterium]|jgi:hypothetical protein|nr:DUF2125 domain-containing protein [Alphaproteobacteria bacterium]